MKKVSGHTVWTKIKCRVYDSLFVKYRRDQCNYCSSDSLITKYTINCKSTALKNGSKLYWQSNCDKIWLTLHTKNKKIVIDHFPIQYYNLTYRLGFRLVKEFENSLLFRGGCPANGPCYYTLIDKTSGQKIKELGQIVDSPQKDYQYNFVIYISKANDFLNIYFPDKKKLLQRHVEKNDFFYTVPIDQFDDIKLDKNILTIAYETARNDEASHKKKITLDIKKYSR